MAKNISERCLAGLKCIEEQLRDASITLEALNSYVNTNIFMINNNIPSNIDDLILLDTVLNYFNNHKDEQVKRSVFNFLFSQKNDLRKMDFLVKLTSLSVATLSSGVLDIISGWIKNNIPKQLLHILIRRLLTDILSINENRNNLLKLIPDASIPFTGAFLIGLTETYQFIPRVSNNVELNLQKPIDHPSIGLLHHVLEWVQKHKQQLFNQLIISSPPPIHGSGEEVRNTPFTGLLFWTLSHPLSKISEENYIEENRKENDVISELHYELLDYMDGLIKASNPYLLSTDYLKYIVDTIKRFEVPQTPQSPLHGQEEASEGNKIESDDGCKQLDLVLIRLSGVIQIGMKNECIQCSNNELIAIFNDLRTHRIINMDLTELKRTINLCKEGINNADQNLIKLTGRSFDKTENLPNQRFNKRRINVDHEITSEVKKPRNDKDGPSLNSVVQITKGRTRDDALTELKNKENPKEKERCKRLFGHLMGTLNSIKKDAEKSTNDPQNITRLKIEKKVEEGNKLINETIQKEQSELLRSKRERQNDLKILNQRYRAAEAFDRWRSEKEKMKGFIRTSKTPFVFYKPSIINEETQLRIDQTAREIDAMIETRKKKLESEIVKAVKYSELHLEGGVQKIEILNMDIDKEVLTQEINNVNNTLSNHNDENKKARSRSPVDSLASEDYEDMIEEIEISMHDENPAVHEDDQHNQTLVPSSSPTINVESEEVNIESINNENHVVNVKDIDGQFESTSVPEICSQD